MTEHEVQVVESGKSASENTVRWRETRARYYRANRDKMRAINNTYYANHREEILAREKGERSEEISIKHAENYARNRNEIRAKQAVYRREHQEEQKARVANYHHQRRANGGSLTLAEWEEIQYLFGHRCAYCGEVTKLTQDHLIPISKGGTHDCGNIVPACQPCNSRKGTSIVSIGAYYGN